IFAEGHLEALIEPVTVFEGAPPVERVGSEEAARLEVSDVALKVGRLAWHRDHDASADTGDLRLFEVLERASQPITVPRVGIVINERDDVAPGGAPAQIPCCGRPAAFAGHESDLDPRVLQRASVDDRGNRVRPSIV